MSRREKMVILSLLELFQVPRCHITRHYRSAEKFVLEKKWARNVASFALTSTQDLSLGNLAGQ